MLIVVIYIIPEGRAAGSFQFLNLHHYMGITDAWYEIFGVDMNRCGYDPQLLKNLLNAALLDAKCKGGNVMTFFCDEAYAEAAKECGFHCVGNYRCYQMHLT